MYFCEYIFSYPSCITLTVRAAHYIVSILSFYKYDLLHEHDHASGFIELNRKQYFFPHLYHCLSSDVNFQISHFKNVQIHLTLFGHTKKREILCFKDNNAKHVSEKMKLTKQELAMYVYEPNINF